MLCRNPNGVLLAGDTAQTISSSVSFRFEDLKNLFYYLPVYEQPQIVPPLLTLAKNFRSHNGILKVASVVVDALDKLFPGTVDKMKPEFSDANGCSPVFITDLSPHSMSKLLQATTSESGIQLGFDYVILVRNPEAKKRLEEQFPDSIILTILESKGLEFQNCLLYDFFADSAYKNWRSLQKVVETPGYVFDPKKEYLLSKDFKSLYVAITRTINRLWVFDSDKTSASYFFKYLEESGVIIPHKDSSSISLVQSELNTTTEVWNDRGDVFVEKKLFKEAQKCYKWSGNPEMIRLCEAHLLYEDALALDASKKLKAASAKFEEAALVFESLKRFDLAAKAYYKAESYAKAAAMYLSGGNEEYFLRCCYKGILVAEFEKWRADYAQVPSHLNQIFNTVARSLALHFHQNKNRQMCLKFVMYFTSNLRIKSFLIRWGYQKELAQWSLSNGNYEYAAEAYFSSGEWLKASETYFKADNRTEASALALMHVRYHVFLAKKETMPENLKAYLKILMARMSSESDQKEIEEYLSGESSNKLDLFTKFKSSGKNSFLDWKEPTEYAFQTVVRAFKEINTHLDQIYSASSRSFPSGIAKMFGVRQVGDKITIHPDVAQKLKIEANSRHEVEIPVFIRKVREFVCPLMDECVSRVNADFINQILPPISLCFELDKECVGEKCKHLHGTPAELQILSHQKIESVIFMHELLSLVSASAPLKVLSRLPLYGEVCRRVRELFKSCLLRLNMPVYNLVKIIEILQEPSAKQLLGSLLTETKLSNEDLARLSLKVLLAKDPSLLPDDDGDDVFANIRAAVEEESREFTLTKFTKKWDLPFVRSIQYFLDAAEAAIESPNYSVDAVVDIVESLLPRLLITESRFSFTLLPARLCAPLLDEKHHESFQVLFNEPFSYKFQSMYKKVFYFVGRLLRKFIDSLPIHVVKSWSSQEKKAQIKSCNRIINLLFVLLLHKGFYMKSLFKEVVQTILLEFMKTPIGSLSEYQTRFHYLRKYEVYTFTRFSDMKQNELVYEMVKDIRREGERLVVLKWSYSKYGLDSKGIPAINLIKGKLDRFGYQIDIEALVKAVKDPENKRGTWTIKDVEIEREDDENDDADSYDFDEDEDQDKPGPEKHVHEPKLPVDMILKLKSILSVIRSERMALSGDVGVVLKTLANRMLRRLEYRDIQTPAESVTSFYMNSVIPVLTNLLPVKKKLEKYVEKYVAARDIEILNRVDDVLDVLDDLESVSVTLKFEEIVAKRLGLDHLKKAVKAANDVLGVISAEFSYVR